MKNMDCGVGKHNGDKYLCLSSLWLKRWQLEQTGKQGKTGVHPTLSWSVELSWLRERSLRSCILIRGKGGAGGACAAMAHTTKPAFFSGSVTQSYSRTVCLHTGCGLTAMRCEEPEGRINKPCEPCSTNCLIPEDMWLMISNAYFSSRSSSTRQAELILNYCACQTV